MPCRQSLGAGAARAARGAGDETNYNKVNYNDGFAVHQTAPPAKATKTIRIQCQNIKVATSLMQGQVSRLALNLLVLVTCLPLAPNEIVIILPNLPILSHGHWPYHWNRAAPPIAPGSVGLLGNESDWGKQNRSKVGLVGKQIDLEEFGKSLDYAELGTASNVGSAFGCWSETAPLQVFSRNLSKHQRQYFTHHHRFEMFRAFPFPACSLVATMVKGEALFGVEASQLRRRSSEELFLTNFWSCQSISYRKSIAYRKVFEMQKQWSAEVLKWWSCE